MVCTREEILQEHILTQKVYDNIIGFLKVCIPQEKRSNASDMKLLDQTRIHPLDYSKLERIAVFIHSANQKYESLDSHNRAEAVKKLFMDHEKLKDSRNGIEEHQVLYGK
jgi:transcriptional accessory protein Tex/SPT6